MIFTNLLKSTLTLELIRKTGNLEAADDIFSKSPKDMKMPVQAAGVTVTCDGPGEWERKDVREEGSGGRVRIHIDAPHHKSTRSG